MHNRFQNSRKVILKGLLGIKNYRKYQQIVKENEAYKQFFNSQGINPNTILQKSNCYATPMTPTTPNVSHQPKTPTNNQFNTSGMKGHGNHPNMFNNSQIVSPRSQMQQRNTSYSPMQYQSYPNGGNHNTPSSTRKRSTPQEQVRISPLVTPGRITMRTPPMNGKLGPIARSPRDISPLANFTQNVGGSQHKSSISKIAKNIYATRNASPHTPLINSQTRAPMSEVRRPIQVMKNSYPRYNGK